VASGNPTPAKPNLSDLSIYYAGICSFGLVGDPTGFILLLSNSLAGL